MVVVVKVDHHSARFARCMVLYRRSPCEATVLVTKNIRCQTSIEKLKILFSGDFDFRLGCKGDFLVDTVIFGVIINVAVVVICCHRDIDRTTCHRSSNTYHFRYTQSIVNPFILCFLVAVKAASDAINPCNLFFFLVSRECYISSPAPQRLSLRAPRWQRRTQDRPQ